MSVVDLEPMIYRAIENWAAGRRHERIGLVTSYDPKTHTAKVMFQPEQLESGQIPIETHAMGNNYGHVTGLVPGDGKTTGDQVVVRYQEGDFESGKISGRIHSDVDMPPQVQSGETAIISQFNASIKMNKDGSVTHATTQKQADGQTDNTAPNISHSATAGNYSASATKANNKGGTMTHTASDGSQVTHTVTMDPTAKKITHQSTDGTNIHTMIFDLVAKTITHKATNGSDTHSIVLDIANGITESTTKSHSRSAQTIADTATTIAHNGNTSITGTLGVSQLLTASNGIGGLGSLGTFASDAAAGTGGVPSGGMYKNALGALFAKL